MPISILVCVMQKRGGKFWSYLIVLLLSSFVWDMVCIAFGFSWSVQNLLQNFYLWSLLCSWRRWVKNTSNVEMHQIGCDLVIMVGRESNDFRRTRQTKRMEMGENQVCSMSMGFTCQIGGQLFVNIIAPCSVFALYYSYVLVNLHSMMVLYHALSLNVQVGNFTRGVECWEARYK